MHPSDTHARCLDVHESQAYPTGFPTISHLQRVVPRQVNPADVSIQRQITHFHENDEGNGSLRASTFQSPDLAGRLSLRQPPATRIVGRQRWTDLLFAHWRVDADLVQATLPQGLRVDTFGGHAYLGIVPFFMERVRPAWLPPLPWLSWFKELNVRTYVHDEQGRPGVWFYSLDCNQPIAVSLARNFFHLPYHHARMSAQRHEHLIRMSSQRNRGTDSPGHFAWTPGRVSRAAAPGSLEFFLVERYLLFTADRTGRLLAGRVHHPAYQINLPTVTELSTGPAQLAGFELSGDPVSVLGVNAVDVSIYSLQPVASRHHG
jgi:uncharacterized protein